jgi:choline dehydrogenase-like flavoprotein
VVGGGVIGLAVAEELARGGHQVVVLERDRVGETAAASAAAGMLAPAAEADATPETTTRLALESHRMYPEWIARLEEASGVSVGFDRSGTVVVALDADDLRELVHLEQAQLRFGLRTRGLSAQEARELQPSLAPSVVGGVLLRDDCGRWIRGGFCRPCAAAWSSTGDRCGRTPLSRRWPGATEPGLWKSRAESRCWRGRWCWPRALGRLPCCHPTSVGSPCGLYGEWSCAWGQGWTPRTW